LLKSGDLFFSPSGGGCDTLLPSGKKIWLNDQIVEMYQDIIELQATGGSGKDGKDGRSVELKVGIFPEGAPDAPENYAVQWKWMDHNDLPVDTWKPLVWYKDLAGKDGTEGPAGPVGPEGPAGPAGTAIKFKGSVRTINELMDLKDLDIGDGFLVTSKGSLWVLRAQPPAYLGSWADMGKILGPQGPRGATGPRGKDGAKGATGDSGSVSMFIIQWMVNAATSAAISGAMTEVSSMVNDAINDAINQMMSEMENMVTDAVEKAVEDALEDIKGEKGDKGDDGEKGDDGKSIRMVGKYELLSTFMTKYPAEKDNVGTGALIGKDGEKKELWAITETPGIGGLPAHYTYEDMGDIQGPKGDAATWEVSVRDKDFVETKSITVESDLPNGVAGMYIQDTDSILVEGLSGSQVNAKQVGFRMAMKYPIPKLIKEGDHGVPTAGKVLGNDGEKLAWVEGGTGSSSDDEILLKGADNRIWALNIDDEGRLHQDLSVKNTDKEVLKLKSPNGQQWGITINNAGKLNISEVY
ncbi:MAG: hypothetical protein ACRC6V_02865, partial [Bacteroidales bacterium]